jgi:hypothetical protein
MHIFYPLKAVFIFFKFKNIHQIKNGISETLSETPPVEKKDNPLYYAAIDK